MYYDYVVKMTTTSEIYEQYRTVIQFTAQDMSDAEAFKKAVAEAKNGAFFDYNEKMWNLDKITKMESGTL